MIVSAGVGCGRSGVTYSNRSRPTYPDSRDIHRNSSSAVCRRPDRPGRETCHRSIELSGGQRRASYPAIVVVIGRGFWG